MLSEARQKKIIKITACSRASVAMIFPKLPVNKRKSKPKN